QPQHAPIAGYGAQAAEPLSDSRIREFDPYPDHPQVGSSDGWTPDHLPYYMVGKMKAVLQEAIEHEGPIEINRLAKVVARRFGVSRLHAGRQATITRLIAKEQIRKSALGTFVWPKDIDPAEYTSFRRSESGERKMEEIAPEEIGNAMAYLVGQANSMQQDE